MKTILKLSREAARYKSYYVGAIFATLCLTLINLTAPRILSKATGIIGSGITANRDSINKYAFILLFLYLILFFVAPLVSKYYDDSNLTGFMRVLSLNVLIGAIPAVPNAILSKNLDFKKSFFRNLANSLTQAAVGIPLALTGFGAWSMVLCKLAGTFVGAIVLWLSVGWWPKKQFSITRCRKLFKYSSKVLASNLLNTIFNNLNSLLIGHYYSTSDVGYYQRGNSIPSTVMSSTDGAMAETLYPSFSQNQDNLAELKESCRRSVQISMFVCCPILIGLLVVSEPLTIILLTEKWLPSVPYMQLSCLICMLWPLSHRTHALNAIGKSTTTLVLNLIGKGLYIIWIIIFIKKSIILLMAGTILLSVLNFVISTFFMKKHINYGFKESFIDVSVPLLIAGIMGAAVYTFDYFTNLNVIISLIVEITIGIIVYAGLTVLVKPKGYKLLLNKILHKDNINGK